MGIPLLNGIGGALSSAGGSVMDLYKMKRQAEQDALLDALRNEQLQGAQQSRVFGMEDQNRQNQKFKDESAQELLLNIPGQQMATPGQESMVKGSLYEGQLQPNVLRTSSTTGFQSMPGGEEPMGGSSRTTQETGPQNGSLLQPLENPAMKVANLNNERQLAALTANNDYRYSDLNRKWAADSERAGNQDRNNNAQFAAINARMDVARMDNDTKRALADMDQRLRSSAQTAVMYNNAMRQALTEMKSNPIAPFEPDFQEKVIKRAQEIMSTAPPGSAPPPPMAVNHAPTGTAPGGAPAGGAPPAKRFTIVNVK